MATLSNEDIHCFKQQAHQLRPTVLIGKQGLTEAVIKETDTRLTARELIKVQVAGDDRQERIAIAEASVPPPAPNWCSTSANSWCCGGRSPKKKSRAAAHFFMQGRPKPYQCWLIRYSAI